MYRKTGQPEAADRDFQQALKSKNSLPSGLVTRAKVRLEFDPEGALEDLQKAFENDRNNAMVLQKQAQALARLKRYDEAIEALRRAIEIEPGKELSMIDRAVLLARFGKTEEAMEELRKATRPPNAPIVLYQAACANALLGKKRHPIALAYLSQAIQAGYGARQLATDSDLDSLREYDEFGSLLKTVELGNRIVRVQSGLPSRKSPSAL